MTRRPTYSSLTVYVPPEDEVARIIEKGGVLHVRIDGVLIVHHVGAPRKRARTGRPALSAGAAA